MLQPQMKLPAHRAGLPGNVNTIIGSALTPLRESVTALPPSPCYRQEGGASSRLARGVNRSGQL
jgi:seryl-tRNA synthetase